MVNVLSSLLLSPLRLVSFKKWLEKILITSTHFVSFAGADSPYTKTALEIVNVCKQTLAEVYWVF